MDFKTPKTNFIPKVVLLIVAFILIGCTSQPASPIPPTAPPVPPTPTPDLTVARIIGNIKQGDSKESASPIKGITLKLSAQGNEFETRSNEEGYFEFNSIPPQKYTLTVDVVTESKTTCRFIDMITEEVKGGEATKHDVLLPKTLSSSGGVGMTATGMIYRCVRQ